jgi:hypothetical protein
MAMAADQAPAAAVHDLRADSAAEADNGKLKKKRKHRHKSKDEGVKKSKKHKKSSKRRKHHVRLLHRLVTESFSNDGLQENCAVRAGVSPKSLNATKSCPAEAGLTVVLIVRR